MIIGATGLIGSGKGAVADLLVGKDFVKIGHSEMIAEELKEMGLEASRKNLVEHGSAMREKHGASYFSRKILSKIRPGRNYVIEGFRNVAEVEEFRKRDDFFLIGVSAGFKRRFNWILKRARMGDPKTLEEFKATEKIDFLQKGEFGQQNALCFSMADYYISNEGNYEDLKNAVEEFLARYDFS